MDQAVVRKPGTFQPRHRLSVGNSGPTRPSNCTQALISQLHEIDKSTGQEKIHQLCEQLIKLALGYTKKVKTKNSDGTVTTIDVEIPPDLAAIREIFDRVEGRAAQSLTLRENVNGPLRMITSDMSPEEAQNAYMESLKTVGWLEDVTLRPT